MLKQVFGVFRVFALLERAQAHLHEGMASPTSREHACKAGCRAEPCPVPSPHVIIGVFRVSALPELPFRRHVLEYVLGLFPVFALLELPFRRYVLDYVFAVFRVLALLELPFRIDVLE